MASIYVLAVLGLTLAAFYAGRLRAVGVAEGRLSTLHSLPVYHGLLAATLVLLPMIAVYAIGAPLLSKLATDGALSQLPSEIAADALRRGAAIRDIQNLAAGQYSGTVTPELRKAADTYLGTRSFGGWALLVAGGGLAVLVLGLCLSRISREFRSRNAFERLVKLVLLACAVIAILTTIGIVFSVVYETYRFFFDPALKGRPSVTDFLFGTEWNPQAALRADQGDIKTAFGFVPLLVGTMLIMVIAMAVAGPLGLFSAIYLSEYATPRIRAVAKPMLEILAGIPTVVLGFFAALTVAPLIRALGETEWGKALISFIFVALALYAGTLLVVLLGRLSGIASGMLALLHRAGAAIAIAAGGYAIWRQLYAVPMFHIDIASESALAAGLVMGMMIIPFISSLSDDVINAVPQSLRDGAYALGATKSETIQNVILPAALPGIVSAFMLAISRAVGETMIVVMAAGLAANLTFNPLDAVTTITVQIKTILVGDQEFDSAKTLAAFALGFVLFFVTLILNFISLRIVKRFREQYD